MHALKLGEPVCVFCAVVAVQVFIPALETTQVNGEGVGKGLECVTKPAEETDVIVNAKLICSIFNMIAT
jgi:hypothetical protein